MAALAPFIEPTAPAGNQPWDREELESSAPIDPPARLSDPHSLEQEIARRNLLLSRQPEVPEDLHFFVGELADQLIDLPEDATLRVDPYFLLAAQRALIGSLRALDSEDASWMRRELRINLEQLRQVYRDLAEGEAVYGDRPAKETARWLAEVLDVPQARLAALVGVSTRTFQRWLSESDQVRPEGDDARRLQTIAAAANHLRHALTGPGVVRWFEQRHSQLDGRRPLDLLDEPDGAARLATLAASTRSHSAA